MKTKTVSKSKKGQVVEVAPGKFEMAAPKGKAKPVAAKVAAKPVTKPVTKPKGPLVYASLLADALTGKYGPMVQRFYVNATKYHLTAKTEFPRARLATQALLSPDEAAGFLKKHEKTSIPPGDRTGQRLFDEMMVQSRAAA